MLNIVNNLTTFVNTEVKFLYLIDLNAPINVFV